MWPLRSESKTRKKKWKLRLIQEEHTESERFIDEFLALGARVEEKQVQGGSWERQGREEVVVWRGSRVCREPVSRPSTLAHSTVSQGPQTVISQKQIRVWEVQVVRACSSAANPDG